MVNIQLEPVESVAVTTLVDNVADYLLQNQGPAKRPPLGDPGVPRVPAAFLEGGQVGEALLAEHGFSALVSVRKSGREHRILFDAGITPDGVVENMRRLSLSPKSGRHDRSAASREA